MSAQEQGGMTSYSVMVGRARLTIDFQAHTIYIAFEKGKAAARTEEIESGVVMVDRAADGSLVGVEVLG